jgi:2-dehydropantoate 2-reductase
MKICVYGAGAIGGHVAARLGKGGADVSVVARGPMADAIRARGLTARTLDGDIYANVAAASDASAFGPQDAVIVTVKGPALASVAQGIAPLLGAQTAVVFAMNGIPWWYFHAHGGPLDGRRLPLVDPGDATWGKVGPQRALGAVVNTACSVIEPGVVRVTSPVNRFALGEPTGAITPRLEAIAQAMRDGGFTIDVTTDIRTEILRKLVGNLCGLPLAALTLCKGKEFYNEPSCADAIRRIASEGLALAEALGRPVEMDIEAQIAWGRKMEHKASMAQDLELHRPLEIDALFTVPLMLARELNVPMPTLELFAALVKLRAQAAGLYPS